MSSFHAPLKPLKQKDTSVPEHLVKGAVIADESMPEWNPAMTTFPVASCYITVDKKENKLPDVVHMAADGLKLPESEKYALMLEETQGRRIFLSEDKFKELSNGFILTMTAAPTHYASKIRDDIVQKTMETTQLETALQKLSQFSEDPEFVAAHYKVSSISQLYELIENEHVKSSSRAQSLLLRSLSNFLDANVDDISWPSVPPEVIRSLAVLIIGQAKSEDSITVLIVLQMMDKLVNCGSDSVRALVLSVVPIHSLIRHLEKSDERVNTAALKLMNSLHENSNEESRREIVDLFGSVPFRSAISGSVLRDGRTRDKTMLDQLVPLQRLLLGRHTEATQLEPTDEQIQQLLSIPVIQESGLLPGDIPGTIALSGLGQFAATFVYKLLTSYAEDIQTLISENSIHVSGGGWELLPMCLHCLGIVAEFLGIVPSENDSVEQLIELLYSTDTPIESFFASTVQLFHRTWREMQAASDEADKVGKVVRQQLRRAVEKNVTSIATLEEAVAAYPYWKMQELWKREQAEKENDQLSSETVSALRAELVPSMESLVRQNRKNFIKRGFTFKRVHKGKSKDHYHFWRLDSSEKFIHMVETDSDPYVEGTSTMKSTRKVNVKDIASVQMGDDGATLRKGGQMLRVMRVVLIDHDVIAVSAQSDRALCAWVDGLNDLIGQKALSRDASNNVDRLLNIELRLRLALVPQPKESIEVPRLPSDFNWVKPHIIE